MRRRILATPLSETLTEEGLHVVDFLREDGAQTEKAERAFTFIYEVVEATLEYHFSKPLTQLGVGMVTRKTVDVALSVALKGLRGPLHRVLRSMTDDQLREVADEIEFRLYPDPHAS